MKIMKAAMPCMPNSWPWYAKHGKVFRDGAGGQVDITYVYHMEDMMPGQAGNPSMEQPTGDWFFPIVLENTSDTPWELYAMDITNLMDGNPLGTYIFEDEESLTQIGLGGLILEPGQQSNWNDAHPAVSDWNGREYRFHFMDGNGQKQSLIFRFENLHEQQNQVMDYSQDPGKDLRTLRHDVYFEQEVYPGVYWVPAVALGASRYSNMDIYQMLPSSPEEKQNNIATLFAICNFCDDVVFDDVDAICDVATCKCICRKDS